MNSLYILRKLTVCLYKVRGGARLANRVQRRYSRSAQHLIINDFDGDLKFNCFLKSHIGSFIFWQGSYSTDQLGFLARTLKHDMTFIDVGANEGEQTIFAAKRLIDGQVISFEPTTKMYERLVGNIQLNGFANVLAVQQGLSDQTTQLPIFLGESYIDGSINEGLASLYANPNLNHLLEMVNVGRLDDFVSEAKLARVDVIKIDVEGAEMSVLKGADDTIGKFQPLIILEVNESTCSAAGYPAKALLEHLQQRGYRFEVILHSGKTRQICSKDLKAFQDVVCYPSRFVN